MSEVEDEANLELAGPHRPRGFEPRYRHHEHYLETSRLPTGRYCSYSYGGDTGPIEITEPVSAPFDVAYGGILEQRRSGWNW